MINLWFDGSCGPVNPGGTAAIGVLIKEDGKTVYENSEVVGEGPLMSNNVAEYAALLDGLEYLIASGRKDQSIIAFGSYFSDIQYLWIPREQNTEADALSNSYPYKEPVDELSKEYSQFCASFLR